MAFQTVTPIRIAQASMTINYLAIYTCPTDARTYMKDIIVCNGTAGAGNVYINIVPDTQAVGASNAIYFNYPLAAHTTFQWKGTQILNEGDTIQVKSSTMLKTFASTATDNCFTTNTTGGTESNVQVTIANHGAVTGDGVEFTGAVAVGGITAPQLNTSFTITRVDDNNFTITTAGTATSVVTGGGTGITAIFSYAPLPTITISGGEAT
jgi:hypothetical protein